MRKRFFILIFLIGNLLNAQTVLTITGQSYTNSDLVWSGVNIPRAVRTTLAFKNNSITSLNTSGYVLQAGDEDIAFTNNNLDGAVITGNKFNWIGTGSQAITHGLFTGYNINYTIKYNYLENLPYAIVLKSGTNAGVNMAYTSGCIAYNIIKNGNVGVRIKGINNIKIYNNTFYSTNTKDAIILITSNDSKPIQAGSTGTKIFNNIFYTTSAKNIIYIESGCLSDFECDYNVYYSESGNPVFTVGGISKTWAQWRALGYDAHSVIMNPNFINISGFVPVKRLDYGIDLGTALKDGLSTTSAWGSTDPGTAVQNGTWQDGAVIHRSEENIVPVLQSSAISNSTPSLLELTYNLTLANIVPDPSSFQVTVNSVARNVNSVAVSGTKVLLTLISPLAYGDIAIVAYTKPLSNPVQISSGGEAASFTAQSVSNNIVPPSPAYIAASIENATPARLDITFSLNLASIVPPVSAFSVSVNSVSRNVSSVSISGTKVLLTLGSPVAFKDNVSVAYTRPSSNGLQTPSGGQVQTMSAQPVSNNVAAPVPIYVSSVIQNLTPLKLEITYSLPLGNSVPAPASFSVIVNSTVRGVASVAISGNIVILTLTSAVANGDIVTFSYTKPSLNPVQTPSGGQAVSLSAQTVTNKIQINNTPPVAVVNYKSLSYSGFISEIDANDSYDHDNDNLTFTWLAPDDIPVSATTCSIIQFLTPVVNDTQNVVFILKVSDGKSVQTKTIPVKILPYEPELDAAEIVKVEASSFLAPDYPNNVLDGNNETMWSADGDNQWLILELKDWFTVEHIKLGFNSEKKSVSYFDILGSVDKITWEPILTKSNSCAFSGNIQVFEFPPSKAEKEYRYIKLIGHGNSTDEWNYISEFKVLGVNQKNKSNYKDFPVIIYPNPAQDFFNVKIDEPSYLYNYIRVISLTGRILLQQKIDPSVYEFKMPVNLLKGMYIIQMGFGETTLFSQKLIISAN